MPKRRRNQLSPFPEVPPVVTRAVAGAMAISVVVACGGDETEQPPQATGSGGDIAPQPGPGPGGFGGSSSTGGAGGTGGEIAPQPGPGPGGGNVGGLGGAGGS